MWWSDTLCLRVAEIRNIAAMLSCCKRESAVSLESVTLIVWWIYSCLISTAIIHSWLPRCLPRGQIVRGNHSERMQGESESVMAALSIGVIIWSKVAAARLSYRHDNNPGTGVGGGCSNGQFYLFSLQILSNFSPSHLFFWLSLAFSACAPKSHFLDRHPCPTSGYLHLGSWVCAYTHTRTHGNTRESVWLYCGSRAKAVVRLFKSCPSKWRDLSKSSAVHSVVCECKHKHSRRNYTHTGKKKQNKKIQITSPH